MRTYGSCGSQSVRFNLIVGIQEVGQGDRSIGRARQQDVSNKRYFFVRLFSIPPAINNCTTAPVQDIVESVAGSLVRHSWRCCLSVYARKSRILDPGRCRFVLLEMTKYYNKIYD